jgi:erythrin-vacuolar iron transport family protein
LSTRGIDFARLSLQDALDLAILIEEEAEERYEEFAQQMKTHHTPEAAQFFEYMAANEAKHGADLSARRQMLFKNAPAAVTRAMLFDVEAPDYDQARAFMSPRQAMKAALQSEEKAFAFFVAALPGITDPEVKALFTELRDEEVVHQNLVRAELAKLPPDSDVRGDAFEDEPTAQ